MNDLSIGSITHTQHFVGEPSNNKQQKRPIMSSGMQENVYSEHAPHVLRTEAGLSENSDNGDSIEMAAAKRIQKFWRRFRTYCLIELLRRYPNAESIPRDKNGFLKMAEPLMWTHVRSLYCPYSREGKTCPHDDCSSKSEYLMYKDFPESSPEFGLCCFSHVRVEPIIDPSEIHPDMCSFFNCMGLLRCNSRHDMVCAVCGKKSKLSDSAVGRSYTNKDNCYPIQNQFDRSEWEAGKVYENFANKLQMHIQKEGNHKFWSLSDIKTISTFIENYMRIWNKDVQDYKDQFHNWSEEQKLMYGTKNMKLKTRRPRETILTTAAALITKWRQIPQIYGHVAMAETLTKFVHANGSLQSVLLRINKDAIFRKASADNSVTFNAVNVYVCATHEENEDEFEFPFKTKITGNFKGQLINVPKFGSLEVNDGRFTYIPKQYPDILETRANICFLKKTITKVTEKMETLSVESEEYDALLEYKNILRTDLKNMKMQVEQQQCAIVEEEIVFEYNGTKSYFVVLSKHGVIQDAYATYLPKVFELAAGGSVMTMPTSFINDRGDIFDVKACRSSVLPLCKHLEEVTITMEDNSENRAWVVNDDNVIHRHGGQILLFRDAKGDIMFGSAQPKTGQLCTFFQTVVRKDSFVKEISKTIGDRTILGPMFSLYMPDVYNNNMTVWEKREVSIEHFLKASGMVYFNTSSSSTTSEGITVRCGLAKLNRALFKSRSKSLSQKFHQKFVEACEKPWNTMVEFCYKFVELCTGSSMADVKDLLVHSMVGYLGKMELKNKCSRYYTIFIELCKGKKIATKFTDFVVSLKLNAAAWENMDDRLRKFKFCRFILAKFYSFMYMGNELHKEDMKALYKLTFEKPIHDIDKRIVTKKRKKRQTQSRVPKTRKIATIQVTETLKSDFGFKTELRNVVDDPTMTRVKNTCPECGHGEEIQRQNPVTFKVYACCRNCKYVHIVEYKDDEEDEKMDQENNKGNRNIVEDDFSGCVRTKWDFSHLQRIREMRD